MHSTYFNIWRVKGFVWQKAKFILFCFFIVPLFYIHKRNRRVGQTIENLLHLRMRLCHIVRYRQNIITILYNQYKDDAEPMINELAQKIINNDVDIHNMNVSEIAIESLHGVVHSYRSKNKKISMAYDNLLDYSSEEYRLLLQAYQTILSECLLMCKRSPWDVYIKIFNLTSFKLDI